jgi:hypothetical protein
VFILVVALAALMWWTTVWERGAPTDEATFSFSAPAGAYDRSLLLELQPSVPGAPIVFTTDGTVPTVTVGFIYQQPVLLENTFAGVSVIRAREFIDGAASPLHSASYAIGLDDSLPILSIIAEPSDLWSAESGILANPWQRGQEWERPVHLTWIDKEIVSDSSGGADNRAAFATNAGLRAIWGRQNQRSDKPAFTLYFREEYGNSRLTFSLFSPYDQDTAAYKRLVLYPGDKSPQGTLLEDQLFSDLANAIGAQTTQGRLVRLFINGEPWGIYQLQERIDRFFPEHHFGLSDAVLVQNGAVLEGDEDDWEALVDWFNSHDLSLDAHYEQLQHELDLQSLTDYAILQAYFTQRGFTALRLNGDSGNTGNGGIDNRWLWFDGDSTRSLDLYRDAGAPLWEQVPSSQAPISSLYFFMQKLFESPDYRMRFATRAADLLNTALSPEAVTGRIQQLAAQIRPDVPYEISRWPAIPLRPAEDPGASLEQWEDNVAALRAWAARRPDQLRQQIQSALGLRGTAPLTVSLPPEDSGYLQLNELSISDSTWQGTYFLDTEIQALAIPAPGYTFTGWDASPVQSASPSITFTVTGPHTLAPRFVPRDSNDPALHPDDVIINEYWIDDNGTRYPSLGGQSIEGDWFELLVIRPRVVDLRGWRVTDNDAKTAINEGSLIFAPASDLAAVPRGTAILVIATQNAQNAAQFPLDDLDPGDGQMVLYAGNGHLDTSTDPGFDLGTGNDNLVLLAPGPLLSRNQLRTRDSFAYDIGIDFVAEGDAVTPRSFGILINGVTFEAPFQRLGNDDGVLFTGTGANNHGNVDWIIDPAPAQSGDANSPGATNILTPGALNYSQNSLPLPGGTLLVVIGLVAIAVLLIFYTGKS